MKMSAWGCPEPCTGITFPRGQSSQAASSRPRSFNSRIARSRYFSRISSSVMDDTALCLFFGPAPAPCGCINSCSPGRASSRLPPAVTSGERAASPPAAGLQELQRLDVGEVLVLADDVRFPHRLEELPWAVEVPQPDLDAAQPLRDVAVRPG